MKRRNPEQRARMRCIQENHMNKEMQSSMDRMKRLTGISYAQTLSILRLKSPIVIAIQRLDKAINSLNKYHARLLPPVRIKPDLRELDKLEEYLKQNGIQYERFDEDHALDVNGYVVNRGRHQIVCDGWDAICHWGSYGYEEGLLEVMGTKVVLESDGGPVCGYLTAEDVIARLEGEDD